MGLALTATCAKYDTHRSVERAFTGPAAAASEWEKWGVEYVVDEINAAGGLLGKKNRVWSRSITAAIRPRGANTARKLAQEKVSAIIGAHCSSATLAMMPIILEAKIPMITGVSSNPQIGEMSGVGGNPFMFRISPDDLRMAQGMTGYPGQRTKLFKKLVIVAEDSDFGRGAAAAFTPLAQKAGMNFLSTDFTPQMTPDFTPLLTRIAQRKPDAIAIFMLGSDSSNLFRNAMQMGLNIPFTGRAEFAGKTLELIQAGGLEGSVSAWSYSPGYRQSREQEIRRLHTWTSTRSRRPCESWGGYGACGRWPRRSVMPRATIR